MSAQEAQLAICARFGARFVPTPPNSKVGVAQDALDGGSPINGLRYRPDGQTSGWYIWAGAEPSTSDDYFQPIHATHVDTACPAIVPYLGLPPGWRFLIADDRADAWFDASLL
jgi:hypothetical protein